MEQFGHVNPQRKAHASKPNLWSWQLPVFSCLLQEVLLVFLGKREVGKHCFFGVRVGDEGVTLYLVYSSKKEVSAKKKLTC